MERSGRYVTASAFESLGCAWMILSGLFIVMPWLISVFSC